MYIYHNCSECGYIGEVKTIDKTVTCPQCQTTNDVWFDGEEPPVNHLYQSYLIDAAQSGVSDILSFGKWLTNSK